MGLRADRESARGDIYERELLGEQDNLEPSVCHGDGLRDVQHRAGRRVVGPRRGSLPNHWRPAFATIVSEGRGLNGNLSDDLRSG